MSVSINPAASNDAWIRSSSSSYGEALFGHDLVLNNADDIAVVGQTGGSTYYLRQYFVQFPYARTTDQIAVSAYFRFYNSVTHGTNIDRDVEIREFDWGGTVNITPFDDRDWRTPSQGIAPLTISGVIERAHALPNSSPAFGGLMRVRAQLSGTSSTLSYLVNSSRNRLQQVSSGTEYNTFLSSRADGAGTANDPQLIVGFHTLSRMTTVLAAQTQLSDGSWIYLERNNLNDEFTMDVKRVTSGGTVTTIASNFTTGVTGNDNMRSAQGYGLCADANDNFFVTYPRYDNTEHLAVRGYKKGVGTTWTQGSELYWLNLSDDNYSNTMQVLCAWHNIGTGRLVVFAMRDWGRYGGAMDTYFLLDASKILNNQSGFVLASGKGGSDGWTAKPANAGNYNPINPTGTLMDLIPDAVNTHTGYLLSAERAALLDQNAATSVGRYRIHSNGISFNSNTFSFMDNNGGYSQHDPDAKLRAISVGQNDLVKIAADARSGWGLTLDRFSFGSTTNTYSLLGRVRMSRESIPSFPDRDAFNLITESNKLNNSQLWDAVYFPADNKIWIYYFDDTDATLRTLMRTSINLSDNLATRDEVEVTTTLGEAGYTPLALRVQRNNMRSDHCMITVAYTDSSDVHKYDYHTDRINIAPTQPLLIPVTNFNATSSKNFTWTFSDPNFVDSQSKFRIQIIDQSDSSVDYDEEITSTSQSHTVTGSSIANDKDYFWQVKTWDSEGVESPWSSQGTFATSDSAIIDIVSPATDNEEIFTKDVLIDWSLTGAQEEYKVTVTRVSDGVAHPSSTDWVTSTDTQYLVMDLTSDVEYLVSVVTRNNEIESNTATRLVLVHYNTPELPEISVTVTPDLEYVTVAVTNPEPRGDRPNPTVNEVYRRVAGTTGPYLWVGDCDPITSFRDYSVGSGYSYEYKVRAGVEA